MVLTSPTLRRFADAESAAQIIAAEGADLLRSRIQRHGQASLVLTGGSAPKPLYEAWARSYATRLDWSRVNLFWGDERRVPLDHEDCNVMTAKVLLDALPFDEARVHPWATQQHPPEALAQMEQVLAKAGVLERGADLTLLGVGPDGHVASLFPQHQPWQALQDEQAPPVKFIADSPKPPAERFTFTLPLINRSRVIYLLPFGESKSAALDGLLAEDESLPVTHVRARKTTIVWTDLAV